MSITRILLIDDHALFRKGLRMVLNAGIPDAEIFEAGSLNSITVNDTVDVVLLDINLPGSNGIEGIAPLKLKWPQAHILMLSAQDEPETVRLALARGAAGFISKAESAEKIIESVKLVLRGKVRHEIEIMQDISDRKRAEMLLRQHQVAIETSHDGFWIIDTQGILLEANQACADMLGYSVDELQGMHVSQLEAKGKSPEEIKARIAKTIAQGYDLFETRHRHKDGHEIAVEVSTSFIPELQQFVAFFRDITQRKKYEENLLVTASVFDNCQEAILITDASNAIVDVNPAFTHITGYSREEVIGENPKFLSAGRQDQDFYSRMWQSLDQTRRWRGEIWNRRKSGEVYAELLSISAIYDNEGKTLRYVAVFSDISHFKEHEAELRRVAHYDALTGIPNRLLLVDRMKQAIAQTSREQNTMAVCYLDLDGFKHINDTMGHEAGDEVLVEVARRIGNTIRGGDTVARLGGDEFVVLLLGLEQGEESVATLERLLAAIVQPITVKNKTHSISASIGVSMYPLDNEDPDTLLRYADQAMYVAKKSGKNRYSRHS